MVGSGGSLALQAARVSAIAASAARSRNAFEFMKRIIAKRPGASDQPGAFTASGANRLPLPPHDQDEEGLSGFGDDAGQPTAVSLSAVGGAGARLDRFLAERLPERLPAQFAQVSRTRLQRWIELGAVSVDGRVLPARAKLLGIESIVVEPQPREADTAFKAEPVPLSVVWRDASLLVIDKPAGLVVHPAAGNWQGTMLNGLLHLDPALAELPRAGIVHRLDKDTSGLLVVARSESAMALLAAQLADRSMGRRYLALVAGQAPQSGVVDAPIGRDERSRVRMAVLREGRGRLARTHFERLAEGSLHGRPVALLQCRLETGRTHQIRVHLAHIGLPLIGDGLYGGPAEPGFERQALHAWRLSLVHPEDRIPRGWVSPPPADLSGLLEQAGIDPAGFKRTGAGVDPDFEDSGLQQSQATEASRVESEDPARPTRTRKQR
jgi:23S rRNA pseudouridine1911/1915/1917 synthase